MTTNTSKAQQVAQEEAEAAALERSVPADEATYELYLRWREIENELAEKLAEQEAITALIKEEMIAQRVRHFTHNGVELTTLSKYTPKKLNRTKLEGVLGKDVVASYFEDGKETYRLNIKK